MSLFGLSFWQQCLPAILFLLLCAGAAAVAHRLLGPAVARLARKLGHPHIALVAEAFLKPAALCMLAVGVWGASALQHCLHYVHHLGPAARGQSAARPD